MCLLKVLTVLHLIHFSGSWFHLSITLLLKTHFFTSNLNHFWTTSFHVLLHTYKRYVIEGQGLISPIGRDTDMAILSVHPSDRMSVTFRYSMKTAQHIVIVSSAHGSPITLVLWASNISANFRRGHPFGGAEYKQGMKILRFSTNNSLYLANDARQRHSYYRRRIGNRTQAFDWYPFKWPWVTSNLDFKVTAATVRLLANLQTNKVTHGTEHTISPTVATRGKNVSRQQVQVYTADKENSIDALYKSTFYLLTYLLIVQKLHRKSGLWHALLIPRQT